MLLVTAALFQLLPNFCQLFSCAGDEVYGNNTGLADVTATCAAAKYSSPSTVHRTVLSMLFFITSLVPVVHPDVGLQVQQQHVQRQKI